MIRNVQLHQYYGLVSGVNQGISGSIPLNAVYGEDNSSTLGERQQPQHDSNQDLRDTNV